MPSNMAVIATLVVLVPVFLVLFAVTGSVAGAALIAVGAGALTGVLVPRIATARARERLLTQVASMNREVAALAGRVVDERTRASLVRACALVPGLLQRTEHVEPANLVMTAEKLRDYLTSVRSALTRYLEIQNQPDSYRDADALLARGRSTLAGFEAFAEQAAQQIGDADLDSFFRDLAHLELMNPPQLPRTEEL